MSTKLIRRALIASGLVLGATTAFSPTAFAQTAAEVNIGGPVVTTLAINAGPGATNLNLAPAQTEVVANVSALTMGTNNSTGLTVTTRGVFNLVNGTGGTIPFTIGIGEGVDAPATYGAPTTTESGINTGAAAAPTTAYGLWVKYSTNADFQDPGTYTAAIGLDVSDNAN